MRELIKCDFSVVLSHAAVADAPEWQILHSKVHDRVVAANASAGGVVQNQAALFGVLRKNV